MTVNPIRSLRLAVFLVALSAIHCAGAQVLTTLMANSLADSVGVNTHFSNSNTPYLNGYTQLEPLLISSGITHFRDGMVLGNTTFVTHINNIVAVSAGKKDFNFVETHGYTQTQISGFMGTLSAQTLARVSLEGPNEYDLNGGTCAYPNFANATCESALQADAVNLKSWEGAYPLVAPSLVQTADQIALGTGSYPVLSYVNFTNTHDYQSNFNPETNGWYQTNWPQCPGLRQGSSAFAACMAKVEANTTVWATETGYGTASNYNTFSLDLPTQAKYIGRSLIWQLENGIARTYLYQFADQCTDAVGTCGSYYEFGLVAMNASDYTNLTPKPSYYEVQGLISTMSDPGTPFTVTQWTYGISGSTANIVVAPFEKRNGTYVLAVWNKSPGWTTSSPYQAITVANQTVNIAFPVGATVKAQYFVASTGQLTTPVTYTVPSSGTLSLSIGDSINLLSVTP